MKTAHSFAFELQETLSTGIELHEGLTQATKNWIHFILCEESSLKNMVIFEDRSACKFIGHEIKIIEDLPL